MTPRQPPSQRSWSLNSKATRGLIFQFVVLVLIALGVWFLAQNTQRNMAERGIQSGFDFLESSAGFDIGEDRDVFRTGETDLRHGVSSSAVSDGQDQGDA